MKHVKHARQYRYSLISAGSVLPELVPEGSAVFDAEDAGAEGAGKFDPGGGRSRRARPLATIGHARHGSRAGYT